MDIRTDRGAGIQVIARAAAVLRALGDHPGGLSLAEIAGRIGLARSTVQRIVQALEVEGFVEARGPQGGFQLGPMLPRLVYRRQIDIVSSTRQHLEMLGAELGETTALCTLTGDQVTALDRCIAERVLRVAFPLGTIPFPAQDLAPGLVMLAQLSPEALTLAMGTPTPPRALTQRLAQVRASGHAEDSIDDCRGFSVALRSLFGLYALCVIVPQPRAQGREERIFAALERCRDELERKFGQAGSEPAPGQAGARAPG